MSSVPLPTLPASALRTAAEKMEDRLMAAVDPVISKRSTGKKVAKEAYLRSRLAYNAEWSAAVKLFDGGSTSALLAELRALKEEARRSSSHARHLAIADKEDALGTLQHLEDLHRALTRELENVRRDAVAGRERDS